MKVVLNGPGELIGLLVVRHFIDPGITRVKRTLPIPDGLERVAAPTAWPKWPRKERLKTTIQQLRESNRVNA